MAGVLGLSYTARRKEFLDHGTELGAGTWFCRTTEVAADYLAVAYAWRRCSLSEFLRKKRVYFLADSDRIARFEELLAS
jgi:hypothetical protein